MLSEGLVVTPGSAPDEASPGTASPLGEYDPGLVYGANRVLLIIERSASVYQVVGFGGLRGLNDFSNFTGGDTPWTALKT